MPRPLVHALGLVKKAAAVVNCDLGKLTRDKRDLIVAAAEEVIQGAWTATFRWSSGRPGRAPRPT